ncbi:MAG: hypothetical protein BMS9Abin17_1043 [Acidimicrobiia bacterium]|nr:MAG: hypothetical protein BMS9Abin17_1043 [Acidimicrobiia bacterium]
MRTYDVIAVGIALALVVRGWRRGLVREAVEVSVLVVGAIVIFRMSSVVGAMISGMANVPYEVGRILGGIVMFVLLTIGGALVSRVIAGALKVVPGATTLNRLGGAALGGIYAAVVLALATTLISVAPLPESVRSSVSNAIAESPVFAVVVAPGGLVQSTLGTVTGESIYGAVISVEDAVGHRLAAGTLPLPIPDVGGEPLTPSQTSAQLVFDELNQRRIAAGVDPLGWSSDLAIVAAARAQHVYNSGVLDPAQGLVEALRAAGVPGTIVDEILVIAATPHGLVEAIVTAQAYENVLTDPVYRISGVGVVEGPFGLIAVQVVSG